MDLFFLPLLVSDDLSHSELDVAGPGHSRVGRVCEIAVLLAVPKDLQQRKVTTLASPHSVHSQYVPQCGSIIYLDGGGFPGEVPVLDGEDQAEDPLAPRVHSQPARDQRLRLVHLNKAKIIRFAHYKTDFQLTIFDKAPIDILYISYGNGIES